MTRYRTIIIAPPRDRGRLLCKIGRHEWEPHADVYVLYWECARCGKVKVR